MAFQNKNMSVIAYANGFTLWHYVSATDTTTQIKVSNYFAAAKPMVNPGDMVMISDKNSDGAVCTFKISGANLNTAEI
jgi:hypothetical protein